MEEFKDLSKEDVSNLDRATAVRFLRELEIPHDDKTSTERMIKLLTASYDRLYPPGAAMPMEQPRRADPEKTDPQVAILRVVQMMEHRLALQQEELHAMSERRREEGFQRRADASTVKMTVRPPEPLEDGLSLKDFRRWEASWDNYVLLTKLSTKERSSQIATFKSFCKPEFLQRLKYAMGISDDTNKDLKEIFKAIYEYLNSQRNVTVDRYKLIRRKQETGETFDDFYVQLCEQAEDANLAGMNEQNWLSTLIISGIKGDELRQDLLSKKPAPTLEQVVSLCRSKEVAEREDKRMQTSVVNANKNFKPRGRGKPFFGKPAKEQPDKEKPVGRPTTECWSCGGTWPHSATNKCRAEGKTCFGCGKIGHFSSKCTKKTAKGNNRTVSNKQSKLL